MPVWTFLTTILLRGTPATGKTALGMVIANHTESHFDMALLHKETKDGLVK